MDNKIEQSKADFQEQLASWAIQESLPRLEELPEAQRKDLIQALASLLMHDPALRDWLEVKYEPK